MGTNVYCRGCASGGLPAVGGTPMAVPDALDDRRETETDR